MCSVELILNGKSVSEWIEEETCAICEILLLVFKLGPKQWQYWHHWQGAWMQRASSFCMNSSCGRRLHVADRRQTRGRHAQQTRGRRCVPPGGEQKEPADKKEKLSKITYNLQQSSSRNSNTPKSLVQDGSFQTLIWMCLEGKFQPRDYIKSNFLWLPLVCLLPSWTTKGSSLLVYRKLIACPLKSASCDSSADMIIRSCVALPI